MEQIVNFGLAGEKIKEADLRKYLPKLHIDPARKKFLNLLLHEDLNGQPAITAKGRRRR